MGNVLLWCGHTSGGVPLRKAIRHAFLSSRNCAHLAFKHLPAGKYAQLWDGESVVCGQFEGIQ